MGSHLAFCRCRPGLHGVTHRCAHRFHATASLQSALPLPPAAVPFSRMVPLPPPGRPLTHPPSMAMPAAMKCVESWSFSLMNVLAGWLPGAAQAVAALSVAFNLYG